MKKKHKTPELRVPLEEKDSGMRSSRRLEDTRMPTVRPDAGAKSYREHMDYMRPVKVKGGR